MADLIVRNLDPKLVENLKKRAAKHGRSAEAEHRAILQLALAPTQQRTLLEVLSTIPDVGTDADFARKDESGSQHSVFD